MKAANIFISGHEIRTTDSEQFDIFDAQNQNVATGQLDPERFDDPDLAIDWEWEPDLDATVLRTAEKAIVAFLVCGLAS